MSCSSFISHLAAAIQKANWSRIEAANSQTKTYGLLFSFLLHLTIQRSVTTSCVFATSSQTYHLKLKFRRNTSAADSVGTLLILSSPSTTVRQCKYEEKTGSQLYSSVSKMAPVLLYDKAHGIGVCVEAVGPKVQLEDYPKAHAKHVDEHARVESSDMGYRLFLAPVKTHVHGMGVLQHTQRQVCRAYPSRFQVVLYNC